MEHCDALLMLGTDFPYRPFLPEGVPVIQVDIRAEHIGRRVPVDGPFGRHRESHGRCTAPARVGEVRLGAP